MASGLTKKRNNAKKSRVLIRNSLSYLLLGILTLMAVSAIPSTLTLQGKLTDQSGAAKASTKINFTFKIYDSFTGGNALWQDDDRNITTDANGIYDAILFNMSSLNFSDQYYLGITVGDDNESAPRINLTSSPYSFRANTSERLNEENKYKVAALNITGNLTLGDDFDDIFNIVTGRLNITDGDIKTAGNLTLAEKITFSFGAIIDNLVSNILKISGKLNVTGNVSIAQNALFVDNTSSRVGIGTTSPINALTVIGDVSAFGSLNATFINASSIKVGTKDVQTVDFNIGNISNNTLVKGDNVSLSLWNASGANIFLREITGRVGIGTTAPTATLEVRGGVNISGGLNVTNGDVLLGITGGNIGIGTIFPNAKLEVNGTSTFGGNVNIPSNNLNVGGGYSAGGVTLIGTGTDKGSGQFAKDILIDGAIVAVYDVELNKSFIPTKNDFVSLGNVSNKFLELFVSNIRSNGTVVFDANASFTGNVSIASNLSVDVNTLFVDSDANRVGIGTTTPKQKLHVVGDTNITGSLTVMGENITAGTNVSILYGYNESASTNVPLRVTSAGVLQLSVVEQGGADTLKAGASGQDLKLTSLVVTGTINATSINASEINVTSLILGWTNLTTYPSACSAGQFATQVGDTLTCSTPAPSSGGGWTDDGSVVRLTAAADLVGIGTAKADNRLTIIGNDTDTALDVPGIMHLNVTDSQNTTLTNIITLDH
ncbi:MAG: hypothetical protein AABX34_07425, partial [Nanoarchaeota archaeon]